MMLRISFSMLEFLSFNNMLVKIQQSCFLLRSPGNRQRCYIPRVQLQWYLNQYGLSCKSNGAVGDRRFCLQGLQGMCVFFHVVCFTLVLRGETAHHVVSQTPVRLGRNAQVERGGAQQSSGFQMQHKAASLWLSFYVASLVIFPEQSCSLTKCFTCNCFKGRDGKLDPVCKEAVTAVENAY